MPKKPVYYAFPTEMFIGKYRYQEIPCYSDDYVGFKKMLKYVVPGYFNQTDYAVAISATLTFVCRDEGWTLAGWTAHIGGWDVRTENEAMMKSAEWGNLVSEDMAKLFFDFPIHLYNNGW